MIILEQAGTSSIYDMRLDGRFIGIIHTGGEAPTVRFYLNHTWHEHLPLSVVIQVGGSVDVNALRAALHQASA